MRQLRNIPFYSIEEYCERRRITTDKALRRASQNKIYFVIIEPISFYYWTKESGKKKIKRCRDVYGYIRPKDIKKILDTGSCEISWSSPSESGKSRTAPPNLL